MAIPEILTSNLLAIAVAVLVLWGISLLRRDASIVDIFWGCGFVLVAWLSLWKVGPSSTRTWILATLVSVWGLRLSGYLAWRNWSKPEDYRYKAMRETHGKRFPLVSLVTVFGLQGLLMWIIAFPIQVGMVRAHGWSILATIGSMTFLVGLFFESVGDYQLARFKANPANRGRVMNQGLWRYTRHPNYFGDFLVWWGLYCVAADSSSWWWTIVGPLLMSFLLVRVSGVRLLENSLRTRVDGYEEYVRNTSAFLPLRPKNTP